MITRPTLIPQALIGEAGRPEGVFPLDRTLGGSLGVMAAIGGLSTVLPIGRVGGGNLGVRIPRLARGGILGDGTSMSRFRLGRGMVGGVGLSDTQDVTTGGGVVIDQRTTVNQRITTPDLPSFRRSQGQIARRARQGIGRN